MDADFILGNMRRENGELVIGASDADGVPLVLRSPHHMQPSELNRLDTLAGLAAVGLSHARRYNYACEYITLAAGDKELARKVITSTCGNLGVLIEVIREHRAVTREARRALAVGRKGAQGEG